MKRNIFSVSTTITFCLLALNTTQAQQGSLSENAMGAESYAMGQTALLSFSDALHVSNSPASIADARHASVGIFYLTSSVDAVNWSAGIVFPTERYGSFGVSYFNFTDDGLMMSDENGIVREKYSFEQRHLLLSYGRNISDKFSAGLNAKFVSQSMANYKSPVKNIGLDAGVTYKPGFSHRLIEHLQFGVVMDNLIKPVLKLSNEKKYLSRETRLVMEDKFIFANSTIAVVGNVVYFRNFQNEIERRFHLGMEYCYRYLSLRAGYRDDFYTMGIGINAGAFNIGYIHSEGDGFPSMNNGIAVSFEMK
jgi:hypothetical protein